MKLGLYGFIIVAGILNGLQTGMNSQLNKSLGQTILAAPIVYLAGLAAMLIAAPIMGARLGDYAKLAHTPWWAFCGGICGAVFIYAMLSTTQKVGAGVFMGLTVTSAVCASVALDHFGALGLDKHPVNLGRGAGVALMMVGVGLLAKF